MKLLARVLGSEATKKGRREERRRKKEKNTNTPATQRDRAREDAALVLALYRGLSFFPGFFFLKKEHIGDFRKEGGEPKPVARLHKARKASSQVG